ncbi:MAG: hypothetical protein H6606_07445 [Flavobacteriales bacterium]|nr:hypothetical protein [Flavobacteriales bacterium]
MPKTVLTYCIALLCLLAGQQAKAARSPVDSIYIDSIRNIEYQLEGLSHNIINSPDLQERITSCYYFIQTLKRALMVPHSFDYEFKLLQTVSILKPDDQAFRIFTWNLLLDSGKYMYFGAIQMNRSDSLQLFGLYDSSNSIRNAEFKTVDHRHWIGALYYQIHHYKYKKNKYYLLIGWDGEDDKVNKKVVDILWFDDMGNPQFGAPFFEVNGEYQNRMIFSFSDQAVMLCRYEPKEKAVVYAHMVPPNPMQKGRYEYYLPDGTYDYLEFDKGFWVQKNMFYLGRSKSPHQLRKF